MINKLIIAQSVNDVSRLEKYIYKNVDILAISREVMLLLDDRKISYKTIEDYYRADSYLNDVRLFNKEVF